MDENNERDLVDALTGLPNRHAFSAALEGAIAEAKRSEGSLSLLYVDLDRLKSVNDALGHDEGDRVLLQVAKTAQAILGDVPMYRVGGDEFVVLSASHLDDAIELAHELRLAVESNTSITATVGVAARPVAVEWDETLLLPLADARVDYAKSYGRRNVVVAEHLPVGRASRELYEASFLSSRNRGTDSIRQRADWVLDVQTGIPGRREFGFRAMELIDRVQHTGEPLSLLLVDVDGLARFNDSHGIDAGDAALRTLARLLDDIARPEHLIGRCGNVGDDFAVLAKLSLLEAAALAETIRVRVEIAISPLTVSVAVVARPEEGTWSEREMLEVCAARMQSARLHGARNLVAWGTWRLSC